MSNTLYGLYVSDVIKLAKTLVVKDVATAEAMNMGLTELGQSVSEDPSTWRYYKNISGSYHSTDTIMTVTSLDTLETINFTVASLQDNRATRKAYAFGSSYYEELVKRYPNQELLIRGILYPVDLQTAINAPDHTILGYYPDLVEPTEANLIPNLQAWTDAWFSRWATPAYEEADDLYVAASFGSYVGELPGAIMQLRLANCKTEFAHSYHIWEYLESNGHLGEYRDYFTTKQAMWLYRNVKYLQMNAGRVANQTLLIDKVMSERGLPVAWYKMIHDITEFETGESLYPGVALQRLSKNVRDATSGSKATHSVFNMLSREANLARDNMADIDTDTVAITETMQLSRINTLPTKILESNILDTSAADVFPYAEILLNEWVDKATRGFYLAKIQVTNPYSGALMSMSAIEAFATWLYVYNRSNGITMDTVPDVVANRARRIPLPTFYELEDIVDPALVGPNELQWILESNADIGVMFSTEAFLETTRDIHTAATNQYFMYATHEHLMARGMCEAAVTACYEWRNCVLDANHPTYDKYFKDRGWYITELDETDCAKLAADILKYATGQDLTNVKSLREIQAAMIKFMTQMSSYSTQWIQTINSSAVKIGGADGAPRLGNDKTKLHMGDHVPLPGPEVLDTQMKLKASEAIDLVGEITEQNIWITLHDSIHIDAALDHYYVHGGYSYSGLQQPIPGATIRRRQLVERITTKKLNGLSLYYIDPLPGGEAQDIPLGQIIIARALDGLHYPLRFSVSRQVLDGLDDPNSFTQNIITSPTLPGLETPEQ